MKKIKGTFEVKLEPMELSLEGKDGMQLGRLSIDKKFSGDLSATSKGEMLSARTPVGSAGYVAIEQVTGSLEGKEGSFILQHFGTWTQSSDHLTLEVVPDSGAGELKGLSGKVKINIEEGHHFYEFEYRIN